MIQVYDDDEALSQAAATFFMETARQAVQDRGRFAVALSGGDTPRRAYELLAQAPLRDQVPWDKTHIFLGDERCVSSDNDLSNEHMAREALLNKVPLPAQQIHSLYTFGSPRDAALRYETVLREFFANEPPRFDLILLGLGENGHTASLFPNSSALEERKCWVREVYLPDQQIARVTLTAPLINQARKIIFIVSGAAKAEVLQEVIEGPADPTRLPAQLIAPADGEVCWMVDKAVASKLQRS
jgi:6-phosphogluconolactonase